MKKSKQITLLFVSGILASCTPASEEKSWDGEKKVYMRSDSTAGYSPAHGFMTGLLLYHVFRPYGYAGANGFQRGYYNGALAPNSNIGRNAYKGNVVRGGMGNSDKSASS
ncbi:hypothetical protein [Chryseobacterium sp.]|jgi:hypothetical protein|uniref:hypothetical protein n=1 Tax=Chryseobacterium sp. TaxID=1871047 RepID=UPI0012A89EF7|nr:hypothetical protein [Chryseobacterium sp.]QFG52077.1 hypothetical protein F7R58_00330 [Chryseobacterium sp.]